MIPGDRVGEDERKTGPEGALPPMADVQQRLAEIRQRRRGAIRARLSNETAELAIRALTEHERRPHRRSSKSRRRKRAKRLL